MAIAENENSADKDGKLSGFFKQKVVMNASLAYGILLGIFFGKIFLGITGSIMRSESGIPLYLLALAFFLIALRATSWGKAVKDKIDAEKSWLKRHVLTYKEPYGAWGMLAGCMIGAVIWRLFKLSNLLDYLSGLFRG